MCTNHSVLFLFLSRIISRQRGSASRDVCLLFFIPGHGLGKTRVTTGLGLCTWPDPGSEACGPGEG